MLVELVYSEETIKELNEHIASVQKQYPDHDFSDFVWSSEGETRYFKRFLKKKGFYLSGLNPEHNINDSNYCVIEKFSSFSVRTLEELNQLTKRQRQHIRNNYGVCDNYKQILRRYPELRKKGKSFIVTITPIYRKEQPESGGWRWHKWGKYIGKYKPKYEYLFDENIDMVYVYHIYEVKEKLNEYLSELE